MTTKATINLINATGTPSSTTFLRGDRTWSTPSMGSGTAPQIAYWNSSSTLTSSPLFSVDTTNGQISVGTTPTIWGDLTGVSGSNGISLNGTLSSSNYTFISNTIDKSLQINRPSGYNIYFREGGNSQFSLSTSSAAANFGGRVIVNSGVPVGTNYTDDGSTALQVNGSAYISTAIGIGGTIQTGFALDLHGFGITRNDYYIGGSVIGYVSNNFYINGGSGSSYINGTNGGNFGIGNTSPSYTLDVTGTFHTTGINTLDNLAGTGTRMVVASSGGVLSTQTVPTSYSPVKQVFVAGTGFTAGTSTTLTVTSTPLPTAAVNIEIFFDGVYQNSTEWSYASPTITFTSAIPSTVSKIEVIWASLAVATGSTGIIATATGINAKTVANTSIYTVPSGSTFICTGYSLRCTAASSITVGPSTGLGNIAGTSNIASTQATGVTTTASTFLWPIVGASVSTTGGGQVYLNLSTAATGTSETIAVDLMGYLT